MYRFVLTPRWLGFALFVAALSAVCIVLGFWQLDRLDDRLRSSDVIAEHLEADPVPIDEVVGADADSVPEDDEWTRVTVQGTYAVQDEVTVKYQSRAQGRGVDVVTPLVTDAGTAVLIDRGWMKSPSTTAAVENVPPPPSGEVVVTGWLRRDSGAETNAVRPDADRQVRAIASDGIATSVSYPLYPGYLNLDEQQPEATTPLLAAEPPELGQGPHFFYGLQWFFFAALAIFGWFFFAWSEAHPRKPRQSARNAPPSTASITPETNEAAGDRTKAATRPNSSGVP